MNFTLSSSLLLDHLQKANGAIDANPTMAILQDFKFDVKDGQLEIRGTDLSTSVTTSVEVEHESDFSFVVPAKMLVNTLKATPEQPIDIQYDEESRRVTVTNSMGKYHMAAGPISEYPSLPEVEHTQEIQLPATVLLDGFAKTVFATSTDQARRAMMGVYTVVENGRLILASTDAHKLVEFIYEDENIQGDASFILPKKGVNLVRSIVDAGDTIRFHFNPQHAFFQFEDTEVACKLIEANYPDYKNIIPKDNDTELSVNRNDFLQSLKRISIFTNESTRQVSLQVNEDSLTLIARDIDYSNDAKEQLACFYKGEPLKIAFNARFLLEMIAVLDSDEIVFKLNSPNRAVLILPSEQTESQNLTMLIMPIII
ncbi:MAG: DNA polymerase III subunit beta [Bacteroidetes bacterium]|jgi:DNA polymerase-3 subunit beta|nr:DNA polymerase III subunit beta [Bacteroidota bacterium]